MKVYIGTSGWQYEDWQGFYPKSLESWMFLPFYVHNFNSVEINVSFYRMVRKKTFENWARVGQTVPNFRFAVKLNNRFTREKKLDLDLDDARLLQTFLENTSGLGNTAGPVLAQLPPGVHCDTKILEKFLKTFFKITKHIIPKLQLAMEFRHKSWLNHKVYSMLKKYNTALVISDSAKWPTEYIKTADFVYVRLHGKPRMFYSLYTEDELKGLITKLSVLKAKEVFIYFNNTMRGHAAENGLELKKLV